MLSLPPELTLAILSYLPLSSLSDALLVCRRWEEFLKLHENPIYHRAALLHGYISSGGTSIENAGKQYSQRSVGSVTNWKDLCRKRRWIERNWSGTGPSKVTAHMGAGKHVHRIKVDEKAGYILTTSTIGGLSVTDLRHDKELWSLPDSHVRPYAHCEYGEGFVIFDYVDGSKEVWRHIDDWNDDEAACVVPASKPTARQLRVFSVAQEIDESATWGHFRPWAILRPPKVTRAFRFSYPTLGAAGWDCIFLWDVRTGALVQTIEQTQQMDHGPQAAELTVLDTLGDINYIEISEKYAILCGTHCLRLFSRATGRSVLDISSSKQPLAAWHLSLSPIRLTTNAWEGASLVPQQVICHPVSKPESPRVLIDEFIAVHISPCGSHLAALMMSSRLIIIHDFERALQPNVDVFDLSLEVQLGSPSRSSRYLAFENGRISAVTKTGVYIVEPDWPSLSTGGDTPPKVSVFRVPVLGEPSCLGAISCLQMTDTGLFLNWDTDLLPVESDGSLELMDDIFYESLSDERLSAKPDNDPEHSTVVSVDFMAPDLTYSNEE
ncbi:hypothetical protein C0991_009370 [Blastosporella zonata]|nr:hypothetical protein C0991_009370 [Blastosporella zonata]